MKKFIVGLLVCAIALGTTGTALSNSTSMWKRFENNSMICSVSKPGGSEGATCVITTGTLEGWSWIIHSYGIEVSDANDRTVFKKQKMNLDAGPTPANWPSKFYNLRNEGVACKKMSYVVSCLIRADGAMQGWGILSADDEIEISDLDGRVKFHRGASS